MLRDQIDYLRVEYGTASDAEWMMFWQIASVPTESVSASEFDMLFSDGMERALEGVFMPCEEVIRPSRWFIQE